MNRRMEASRTHLPDGRWHFQHGPIDIVIGASGNPAAVDGAHEDAWLRFRGGKGVATLLGIALALHWPVGLVFAAVWIAAMAVTRFSSVGGMAAAVATPVAAAMAQRFDLVLLFLALALMVLWKHRANLERLMAGTEPRIGGARLG